ncbi:MAG: substrate-binding domain-containing protein [Actinopolymorphaceae bacterium]
MHRARHRGAARHGHHLRRGVDVLRARLPDGARRLERFTRTGGPSPAGDGAGRRVRRRRLPGSRAGQHRCVRPAPERVDPARPGGPLPSRAGYRCRAPDHFAIGYEVTNRLVELGHRNLAMLWSETESTSVQERLSGHDRSLREHGLPVRPGLTVTRRYWSEAEGTHPSLLRDLLADSDPPSVLLCANGYVLAAAAINLMDLGIEFPEQIELAGMDDAGPFEPLPITTVAAVLPSRELGREAMRLLAERIATGERQDDGRRIVLPISLSTRESADGYLRAVSGARP